MTLPFRSHCLVAAAAALLLPASMAFAQADTQAQAGDVVALAAPAATPRPVPAPHALGSTRSVDLVLALDTSASMDEMLDSVRSRLWDVVLEFARMQPQPELRVGLISYGSPVPAAETAGWVVQRLALTSDLDAANAALMGLKTDGGDEYVGFALREAVDGMEWDPSPDGLRIVFVAGNESAEQGQDRVDFRAVAKDALTRDIVINAIFAGSREGGAAEAWDQVARHGRGNFSAIDVNAGLLQLETPLDAEIIALNERLNGTYLPYGEHGAVGLANQAAQDLAASRLGVQSCSSRVVAKGTALYDNAAWDLVDAARTDDFQWGALTDDELPEALRGLTREQRAARVSQLRGERTTIQESIQQLSDRREAWLQEARSQAQGGQGGIDEAMLEAIREQAKAKGFVSSKS